VEQSVSVGVMAFLVLLGGIGLDYMGVGDDQA